MKYKKYDKSLKWPHASLEFSKGFFLQGQQVDPYRWNIPCPETYENPLKSVKLKKTSPRKPTIMKSAKNCKIQRKSDDKKPANNRAKVSQVDPYRWNSQCSEIPRAYKIP